MSEKGYRLVRCPGLVCRSKLRLRISEKVYGKEIEVTCTKCGEKFRTTIPVPASTKTTPAQKNSFDEIFGDVFGSGIFTTRKKP